MPLINCEFNPIVTWSANCLISEGKRETKFAITHKNLCFICNFIKSR